MAKAKYSNLVLGVKVLADDANSFNVNEKGYNFVKMVQELDGKAVTKKDFESVKCGNLNETIEKLYKAMVEYHAYSGTKAERKAQLEKMIELEYSVLSILGMVLRENGDGVTVSETETITINQYELFEDVFCIKATSKRERANTGNNLTVVSLSQFKKSLCYALLQASMNNGEMYKVTGKLAENLDKIEKRYDDEYQKQAKAQRIEDAKVNARLTKVVKGATVDDDAKVEEKKIAEVSDLLKGLSAEQLQMLISQAQLQA